MRKKLVWGGMIALLSLVTSCHTSYQMSGIERTRILVDSRYDQEPDARAEAFLLPYRLHVDSVMNPVVGYTARYLERGQPEGLLSNLLPDILVWASDKYGEKPDFGVYNYGGIRGAFPAGKVTLGDVLDVAPFENKICFGTLRGSDVLELFGQFALMGGQGVSHGVYIVYDKQGKLVSATIHGKPVDPEAKYRFVTLDYLAHGVLEPLYQDECHNGDYQYQNYHDYPYQNLENRLHLAFLLTLFRCKSIIWVCDESSVSSKMRQSMGRCIVMNNEEKNTYVRNQITQALLRMLESRTLEEISVSDLCLEAKVGRASFYRNYGTKEDVIRLHAKALILKWAADFEARPDASPLNVFESLFEHYRDNRGFYLLLCRQNMGHLILDTIKGKVGLGEGLTNADAYGKAFLAYGIYGWVLEWMNRGMVESPQEMNALLLKRK